MYYNEPTEFEENRKLLTSSSSQASSIVAAGTASRQCCHFGNALIYQTAATVNYFIFNATNVTYYAKRSLLWKQLIK
uniref:Bm1306, isoform a n=1 Tax=Brugia malayi TaxID=6279 RepID=A0A1I9G233_BRUMA|nr:Bm1306, isoform a [Brugia malayi]